MRGAESGPSKHRGRDSIVFVESFHGLEEVDETGSYAEKKTEQRQPGKGRKFLVQVVAGKSARSNGDGKDEGKTLHAFVIDARFVPAVK